MFLLFVFYVYELLKTDLNSDSHQSSLSLLLSSSLDFYAATFFLAWRAFCRSAANPITVWFLFATSDYLKLFRTFGEGVLLVLRSTGFSIVPASYSYSAIDILELTTYYSAFYIMA